MPRAWETLKDLLSLIEKCRFSFEANDGSHAMVRLLILRRNSGKVSDYSLCPHSRNNADNDEDDDDDCDK